MKRWLRRVLLAILVLVLALGVLMITPISDPDLSSNPQPLGTYAEAAARIDQIVAAEDAEDLIPEGHSIALLTGDRADTCVVIFHGYTSVPEQFRLIAETYRELGYNVWVPRLPYHGSTDKMTDGFSELTARGLRDFADETLDIAAGLGERVLVIGFSGGGSLAVWTGVERSEVSQTVLISPLLHPLGFKEWQDRPLVRLLRTSPVDIYAWWDPAREGEASTGYNYPRFSYKGIAALLSLAHWADAKAAESPYPIRSDVLLIKNDGDPKLDGAYNVRFAQRMAPPERLTIFTIPASEGFVHNIVSPAPDSSLHEKIDVAYEYLSEALGIPLPVPSSLW